MSKQTPVNGRTRFADRPRILLLCVYLVALVTALTVNGLAQAEAHGRIMGRLFNAETGEALLGVSVRLEGTKLGAQTDLDGNYLIRRVPVGTYTLVASSVGYTETRVTEVVVTADGMTKIELALRSAIIETKDKITVTAKRLRNTEASLLHQRSKSNSVSDAISAEGISRSGSSDAAQAMTRVTGASVVDGKHVFVRGLGDRYANTRINGSLAPSADPDKQSVHLDLVPAALLDNIVVEKSFTPDKQGNFSGGSVNIITKDLPEGRTITFTSSTTYNSETTTEDNVLSYAGGGRDWLGMDDGTRDVPSWMLDPNFSLDNANIERDTAKAIEVARMSRELSRKSMDYTRRSAPLNQSYGFSYGDLLSLFDRPLGFSASLSYARNASFYEDGRSAQWSIIPLYGGGTLVTAQKDYTDAQGKDEVLWGGLINTSYQLSLRHKVKFTYMYNRNGESTARLASGYDLNLGDPDLETIQHRNLLYSERTLTSAQLSGEHAELIGKLKAEWAVVDSKSDQDEPDNRYFTDYYAQIDDTTRNYGFFQNKPSHYFREMSESNREARFDLTYPFKNYNGMEVKFKAGFSYLHKTRDQREKRFSMIDPSVIQFWAPETEIPTYNGNPDDYLSQDGLFPDDTVADGWIDHGVLWYVSQDRVANFDAEQNIAGSYFMTEFPLTRRINLVGGFRYETTEMIIDRFDSETEKTNLIDDADWLPSIAAITKLRDNMNLRLGYGKTLARPTMRELSPYATFEFLGFGYLIGNDTLRYSVIHNYDLRWEWFTRPGEIIAVSAFSKDIVQPIELEIKGSNNDRTYRNASRAFVYGLEFEFRRRMDHAFSFLRDLSIGGNLTIAKSEVTRSSDELVTKKTFDPNAGTTREMSGQSPYVINLDMTYNNQTLGTVVSLMYNKYGKRLYAISLPTPDVYEFARESLDVTVSQKIWRGITFKASGKNLTDSQYERGFEFEGQTYYTVQQKVGQTFGLGISYTL